ncbi:MAG TPA: MFS transporter [Candidatus Methylomirabilis sp.]|nr:MFS transporter [Candidatus Methylomirabilis sp.]HSC71066.1 MFS transporter [Candidatus Methylomirabilis sp.]
MQEPADGSVAIPTSSEAGDARKWWALVSVAFGAFMAPLDSSIVNTVLPIVAQDFRADILLIEWVVLAYLLTLSSLLLIGGRLGDLIGDRRLYVSGFALFTVSSALCGASTGVATLIAARVLQAIGGAMLIAIGPAILTRAFPASQRGRALGIQASVVYVGLAVGPGLGGLIASTLGWRWVFFINLPIGVVAIGVALSVLRTGGGRPASGPFDFVGAATYMLTLFAFVLALSRGTAWGWGSLVVVSAGTVSMAAGTTFLWVEWHSPHPFFDIRLFRHRLFAAATLSALSNYMASNTTAFLTPFFLIRGHQMTPAHAGSLIMAMPIVMAAVAPASGWLSDRIGSRVPTVAGMTCLAAGMWLLAHLGPGTGDRQVVLCLGLAGLGVGLFTSPNNSAIMGAVPQTSQGLASGLVATARTLGMILGVALSGSLFGAEVQQLLRLLGQESMAVNGAFRHAVSIGAGIALGGALTSLIRGKPGRS